MPAPEKCRTSLDFNEERDDGGHSIFTSQTLFLTPNRVKALKEKKTFSSRIGRETKVNWLTQDQLENGCEYRCD